MEILRKSTHAGMIYVGLGSARDIFLDGNCFFPTLIFSNVRSFIGIVNLRKICNLRKTENLNLRNTLRNITFSKPKGFQHSNYSFISKCERSFSYRFRKFTYLRITDFMNFWELGFLKCGDVPKCSNLRKIFAFPSVLKLTDVLIF